MNFNSSTEEMIRRIGTIQDEVGASVCFGSPIERDGHTIVPVARVSFGYGLGFGGGSGGEGGGGGGGGGGSSTPVAVIDIAGGDVKITPINDTTRIALSSFAFVAWVTFWLFLTVRTFTHESAKTRREKLKLSS